MTGIGLTSSNRSTTLAFGVSIAALGVVAISILVLEVKFLLALTVVPWFIVFFYQKPIILLCLWPIVNLIEVFFPFTPLRAGGIAILPMDPIYFFTIAHLSLCAISHPKNILKTLKENRFLSVFLALVAVSVILYTPVHGQSAVGEARKFYFVFLFPLLAAMSIKSSGDLTRFLLVVIAVATSIAAFALYRTATTHTIVRVLNSEATLILALCAFVLLLLRINKIVLVNSVLDMALLSLFSLFALSSGQRSVWLSIGVGSIILLWLYRHRAVFVLKALVLTGAILVAIGVAIFAFPEAGSKLTEKFAGIIDPYADKTASWRLKGWEAQLETISQANPLFGEGLGGYYNWKLGSHEINFSPHNAYVQMILKFGVLGLIVYALLVAEFLRKTLTIRESLLPCPMKVFLEIGIVCFGAGHGYMMGYSFEPVMLCLFGVGVSAVKLCKQSLRDYRLSEFGIVGMNQSFAVKYANVRLENSRNF